MARRSSLRSTGILRPCPRAQGVGAAIRGRHSTPRQRARIHLGRRRDPRPQGRVHGVDSHAVRRDLGGPMGRERAPAGLRRGSCRSRSSGGVRQSLLDQRNNHRRLQRRWTLPRGGRYATGGSTFRAAPVHRRPHGRCPRRGRSWHDHGEALPAGVAWGAVEAAEVEAARFDPPARHVLARPRVVARSRGNRARLWRACMRARRSPPPLPEGRGQTIE